MTRQRIVLAPVPTAPGQPDYQSLLTWPFPSQPFYEGQVLRLLQSDIPQRVAYGFGLVWAYRDPGGNLVGFGTLDLCKEYEQFTEGKYHPYLPVLAVHPNFRGLGHSRSITEHLMSEAALCVQTQAEVSPYLFLDVYTANDIAIAVYQKQGFDVLNQDSPIPDPQENNELYFIMARNVAVASG